MIRKSLIKRIITGLAAGAMCLSLTGCGSGKEPAQDTGSEVKEADGQAETPEPEEGPGAISEESDAGTPDTGEETEETPIL